MKISCPDCQASYDVDLPDLPKEGTQVKCAKCQQSFLVTPEDSEESSLELDSMLDDLIEGDMAPNTETTTDDSAEPELDSMLDDLIEGDMAPSTETTADDSAEPELDSMLDDLIESDIEPNTETTAEGDTEETPLSFNDGEEPEFDTMADDASSENDDDLDGLLDDMLEEDDNQENVSNALLIRQK